MECQETARTVYGKKGTQKTHNVPGQGALCYRQKNVKLYQLEYNSTFPVDSVAHICTSICYLQIAFIIANLYVSIKGHTIAKSS